MRYFGYLIALYLVLISSCKNSVKQSSDLLIQNPLLEKAIIGAGGLENWKGLRNIQFYKTTKLYHEDGSLQDSTYQLHNYQMYPDMTGSYSYEKDGMSIKVMYQHDRMTKYVNDESIELSDEEAKKLKQGFLGSQFVMSLPFKLNDPGVILSKEEGLLGDRPTDILKASYNTENTNHTKTHDWWHYIDKDTGELLGYKVHHAPTYAQVYNVTTTKIRGITFPTYRKTYRVTENDEVQYVRGEFWYEYISNE